MKLTLFERIAGFLLAAAFIYFGLGMTLAKPRHYDANGHYIVEYQKDFKTYKTVLPVS